MNHTASQAGHSSIYDSSDLGGFERVLIDACAELVERRMTLDDPRTFATMRRRMAAAIFAAAAVGERDPRTLRSAALNAASEFARGSLRVQS